MLCYYHAAWRVVKIAERRFGLAIRAQTRILWVRRRQRADGDVVHCTPLCAVAAARCPVGVYLMPLYVAGRYNHAKGSCGCCGGGRQPVRRSRITADGTACRMDPSLTSMSALVGDFVLFRGLRRVGSRSRR